MEKEEKKDLVEETELDSTVAEEAEEEATEETAPSEEKNRKGNMGILIAEGVIAVAAIGFIGFAIGSSVGKKNNHSEAENQAEEITVVENETSGGDSSAPATEPDMPDNSDLEALRPAVLPVTDLNPIAEKDAKAAVSDKTMLQLTTTGGETIYVPNYENEAYLAGIIDYSEEAVDAYIEENFLSQISEMQPSDKTECENGDTVNIDYLGTLDGVAFDGGTATDCNLSLGSHSFIEGFEEGLVGAKVGDVVELNLTFPENYYEELAGKDVVFTVSVNCIMQEVFPKLTDELVQEYFEDMTTAEECRAYFKEQYIMNNLYLAFTENVYQDTLNEEIVKMYYDYNLDYYSYMYGMYYGVSLSEMLGDDIGTLLNEINVTAADSAYKSAIFRAIAEKENIVVTDEDIMAMASEYGYTSQEEFLSFYDKIIVDDAVIVEKVLKELTERFVKAAGVTM